MEGWFLSQFSKWQLKDKIHHEKHCLKNTWLIITTCVAWVESIFKLVLKMHHEECHFKSTWLMVGTIVGWVSNGRLFLSHFSKWKIARRNIEYWENYSRKFWLIVGPMLGDVIWKLILKSNFKMKLNVFILIKKNLRYHLNLIFEELN
jgi:hypothetical protein